MALVHRRKWSAAAHLESPWYFPLRALWSQLHDQPAFPTPERLTQLYAAQVAGLDPTKDPEIQRLAFVAAPPHKPKRRGTRPVVLADLYEGQIVERGQVPTRLDDWHDFFNALTFAAFPRAKWALHQRQYRLLQQRIGPDTRRLPGARTREQDALSLFDEGGIALLVAPDSLPELQQGDFPSCVRALCRAGKARAVPFGHALHEHLVEGLACPLGTVHPIALAFTGLPLPELLAQLDVSLARDLGQSALFAAPSVERGLSLGEIGDSTQEEPTIPC